MDLLEKEQKLLETRLGWTPRALIGAASLLMLASFAAPLWNITMFAPQYGNGLRMDVYSYKLEGGNGGQDIREINVLNHYIGMRDIAVEDFTQFKWLPFAIGAITLLFLRAAVMGGMAQLVDVLVLFAWFGIYSLWSFGYTLYRYGHELAPTAAVKVAAFMPPMLGHEKMANFDIYSYPGMGSWMQAVVLALLGIAFVAALRSRWVAAA
jgi:hypothetical protein